MKIVKIILSCLLVFSLFFTIFCGADKIKTDADFGAPEEYKGILSLWHIDTFEGGTGSRKQFLLSAAASFEKTQSGALIMVTSETKQSAEEKMKNGVYPDMISYGNGVNVSCVKQLKTFNCKSGAIEGKSYGAAWCRGGYCLIINPQLVSVAETEEKFNNKNLVLNDALVSASDYTLPLIAAKCSGVTVQNAKIMKPLDAYVKFTGGKVPFFIGTQRDIIRLENRGINFGTLPLNGFCDLYQYISVASESAEKKEISQRFIDFLCGEKIQKKLNTIGMFSVGYWLDYQGEMKKLETAPPQAAISLFTSENTLINLKDSSVKAAAGDTDALNIIKKILI